MRINGAAIICLLASSLVHAFPAPREKPALSSDFDEATVTLPSVASAETEVALDQLAELAKFASDVSQNALTSTSKQKRGPCTLSKLSIRREWGTLSKTERKAYNGAVQCFVKKQAKTPKSLIPGAISRFDDWVGTHINHTNYIHYTGTFLAWHRYFTWAYEQALRKKCGYTGTQPYWDWSKTAVTGLTKSPIFDGSDTSMSGNGVYIPGNELGRLNLGGPEGTDLPPLYLPTGYGGGCIESGPFKDLHLNLGPVSLPPVNGSIVSNGNGFGYNPRCIARDPTDAINQRFANATSVVRNILAPDNIWDFQMTMQGTPGTGDIGIHGGGHYAIGGDPARDFYISLADPVFYLHHSTIDRVWWIWQNLHPNTAFGAKGISGTGTFLNTSPSANTTFETPIDLGYAWEDVLPMKDLMSTTAGPFCYIYL